MSIPIYACYRLKDMPEYELRASVVMLRLNNPQHNFSDNGWGHVRVESQLFDIDDEAIQYVQSKVTDMLSCCAVRYRMTPESMRLRGALTKLNQLVRMLGTPGNSLRLERKIVLQREKIVSIKLDLAPRSTENCWLVGGLVMG